MCSGRSAPPFPPLIDKKRTPTKPTKTKIQNRPDANYGLLLQRRTQPDIFKPQVEVGVHQRQIHEWVHGTTEQLVFSVGPGYLPPHCHRPNLKQHSDRFGVGSFARDQAVGLGWGAAPPPGRRRTPWFPSCRGSADGDAIIVTLLALESRASMTCYNRKQMPSLRKLSCIRAGRCGSAKLGPPTNAMTFRCQAYHRHWQHIRFLDGQITPMARRIQPVDEHR